MNASPRPEWLERDRLHLLARLEREQKRGWIDVSNPPAPRVEAHPTIDPLAVARALKADRQKAESRARIAARRGRAA